MPLNAMMSAMFPKILVVTYILFSMLSQYPKELTTLCGLDIEKVILVVVRDTPKE